MHHVFQNKFGYCSFFDVYSLYSFLRPVVKLLSLLIYLLLPWQSNFNSLCLIGTCWGRGGGLWQAVFLNSRKKAFLIPKNVFLSPPFLVAFQIFPTFIPDGCKYRTYLVLLLFIYYHSDRVLTVHEYLSVNFIPLIYVSWVRLDTKIFKSSKPNSST